MYSIFFLSGNMHIFFRWGGEEEFPVGRVLHGENFPWRGKFQGVSFAGNILHRVNLPEFLYEILLCPAFSSPIKFYAWRC